MRLNAKQAISTPKLLLVPYSAHHVPTYHTWMQDPALQAATASEPLTVEEEYAMQRSWREDKDKLTFIICLPPTAERDSEGLVQLAVDDALDRMIGDINLFLFEPNEDDEDEDKNKIDRNNVQSREEVNRTVTGEIELMIARKDLHRQGYGRAALETFMEYIITNWSAITQEYDGQADVGRRPDLAYLRAKIQQTNVGSLALFESIGFKRVRHGEANYFGEIELRWQWEGTESLSSRSKGCLAPLTILQYDDGAAQPANH